VTVEVDDVSVKYSVKVDPASVMSSVMVDAAGVKVTVEAAAVMEPRKSGMVSWMLFHLIHLC
jgi:hypothetical protein